MEWTNSHLCRFDIGGSYFGEPSPEYEEHEIDMKDARRARLSRIAPRGKTKLIYKYDSGDSWLHEIAVERILPVEAGVQHLVCLTGYLENQLRVAHSLPVGKE